jgi:3'(2'), 5'-bisphosphate nucleotidase
MVEDHDQLLNHLADSAREAGEAILAIVRRGFDVEAKRDSSPVTEADRAAELIILAALARAAPGVPTPISWSTRSTEPRSSSAAAATIPSTSG